MKLTITRFLLTSLFLATSLKIQADIKRVDEIGFRADTPPETPETVENQYLVKLKPAKSTDSGADAVMSVAALKHFPSIHAVLLSGETMIDEDAVEYVEPNYILKADNIPNDPDYPKLWGLQKIGLEPSWDRITGSDILIAVIDSGIDYTHPDLMANMWQNPDEIPGNAIDDDNNGYVDDVYGYDFANIDNDPFDDFFHGTHCAGIIAAVGNNGTGVVGVNWSAKLMALKFMGNNGYGDTAKAIAAIEYAINMGAKIISNSWGGDGGQALKEVIQVAKEHGILFVAAAGNKSKDIDQFPHYPASYDSDNIISVAATDANDGLAVFSEDGTMGSNYGAISVDLAAPGVEIYSTMPNNQYGPQQGTSMATPYVTGVAALVWAANPTFTYQQVKDRLLATVDLVPALTGKTVTGGRLNAYQALITETPTGLPVASCTATAKEMQVTFDGSASRDTNEGGYLTSYRWTVSNQADAAPASGQTMVIDFSTPGTYEATLTVTDNDNLTGKAKCSVTVPPKGEPEAPMAADIIIGSAPLTANFDVFGADFGVSEAEATSCESEGSTTTCTWTICKMDNFGNCIPTGEAKEECKFLEMFDAEGTYKVTPTLTACEKIISGEKRTVKVLPTLGRSFAGGISVNQGNYQTNVKQQLTDEVDIVGEIKPVPAHVNQLVDIVVYALYPQFPTPETGTWFMLDSAGAPLVWDGNPANLVAFKPQIPLTYPHLVSMYKGQFVLPGHLLVYLGYRLPDGTLVNSNNPIDIMINQ